MSLSREQKEAAGLLQVGTFLEYFDLMLYVHMAVLLNELFFPQGDTFQTQIFSAVSFCSTFFLMPFGSLLFGYVGDKLGRKPVVVLTTMMMSFSCLVMANLPTYAQIGIAASWVVTLCRVLQGFSSVGEVTGSQIYLTEISEPPSQYALVSFINVFASLGSISALGVASLVSITGLDWRMAFWAGTLIAVVGTVARSRLRETAEFVDMKRRLKRVLSSAKASKAGKVSDLLKKDSVIFKQKVDIKASCAYFFVCSAHVADFYFVFVFCSQLLKLHYGYSALDVIVHNFWLAVFDLGCLLTCIMLTYKFNPLKIIRARLYVFIPLICLTPVLMDYYPSAGTILFIQLACMVFKVTDFPGAAIFINFFPVFKRFTAVNLIFSLSRALIYSASAFGLVLLTNWIGNWGIFLLFLPIVVGFTWGLNYLEGRYNHSQLSGEEGERRWAQGVVASKKAAARAQANAMGKAARHKV